ncbi:hypothetical protein AtubIFM55763_005723 [Aspergillus tubingensis]|uniref:Uncharacterized protein n=1 Tax=Aspergillus tubingensis TaxID=5068 RepID=A0A8H3T4D8_ASPTU|nr:pectinesterase family protein [Aspergillus tubingensis]GFN20551.1 pectinesterase family protein [Aspergillus tubingensis]GLA74479.1 hypothetical protein AtubIFM55763_005723 [Aspergillus tubingensis]GLA82606.1 hypothetical protein AtubIFM56815_006793 [Aspergillus tubingensis]GLB22644.1 hypothetical protein AtubIFM61612_003220 [Aspergillus tubingensis]
MLCYYISFFRSLWPLVTREDFDDAREVARYMIYHYNEVNKGFGRPLRLYDKKQGVDPQNWTLDINPINSMFEPRTDAFWRTKITSPIMSDDDAWEYMSYFLETIDRMFKVESDNMDTLQIYFMPAKGRWTLQELKGVVRAIIHFKDVIEDFVDPYLHTADRDCEATKVMDPKVKEALINGLELATDFDQLNQFLSSSSGLENFRNWKFWQWPASESNTLVFVREYLKIHRDEDIKNWYLFVDTFVRAGMNAHSPIIYNFDTDMEGLQQFLLRYNEDTDINWLCAFTAPPPLDMVLSSQALTDTKGNGRR